MTNTLYYGDNLDILREQIEDETVDLIYLDPPFNSSATYNVLFKAPVGHESHARLEAFEDTWRWTDRAERAFDEVMKSGHADVAKMLRAMRSFLKENAMMAYLAMMAVRMIELHRVLKPTGSLYLHCDPTASHYLKVLLDAVFDPRNFLNEITWKRTSSHNTARRYGNISDTLLLYRKSETYVWNNQYTAFSPEQLSRYKPDETGRLYKAENLTADRANSDSGKFAWRGTMPPSTRGWGYTLDQLETWWAQGKILTRKDGAPRMDGLKVYLDELPGQPLQSIWTDIERVANTSKERSGYPTQKPLALLERVIRASSNEGDLVLDPFCGCGTTAHAAQKLGRQWIGIDVTHLAISLVRKRLSDAFGAIPLEIVGAPKDVDGARELAAQDKHQFRWWAVSLVDALPFGGKEQGADRGIDGVIYFKPDGKRTEKAIVSVEGGRNVGVGMVKGLNATIAREKSELGIFITLAPPTSAMVREAVTAGRCETDYGQLPRIQILTVEALLNGEKPHVPWIDPTVFKKAPREVRDGQRELFDVREPLDKSGAAVPRRCRPSKGAPAA